MKNQISYTTEVRERAVRLPDRIKWDMRLKLDIQTSVWKDNFRVYGARKVWWQLL